MVEKNSEKYRLNDDSFEQMFKEYHPLIYSLQKKYYIQNFDSDDWIQESMIIFYQALQAYESSFGVTFGAFYKQLLSNHIRSLIRKQCAYKRKTDWNAVSLEEKIEVAGPDFLVDDQTDEDYTIDRIVLHEKIKEAKLTLSSNEKAVLKGYLEGKNFETIAKQMSLEIPQVRGAYDRVRRKIKNMVE